MSLVQDVGCFQRVLDNSWQIQCFVFSTKFSLQITIISPEFETLKFDLAMEGQKVYETTLNLVHDPQFTIFRG